MKKSLLIKITPPKLLSVPQNSKQESHMYPLMSKPKLCLLQKQCHHLQQAFLSDWRENKSSPS